MRYRDIEPKKLVVFDIDDTLVHTQTKVHVVKDGNVVNSLNSHDFTHYKLQPGESFDFEDFRNAREFFEKSKPIIPMMRQLKQDIATGNKVVMVTARADFDDKELFLDTFRKYGVDMNKVHVYRAGNLKKGSTEERKKIIIKNLLDKENYSKAIMYDDAKPNLHSFMELKKIYPKTRFYAWHVSLDGEASEYMRENIVSEKKRKRRHPRWAIYGPGLYGGYGYDVGYSGEGDGIGEQTSQTIANKNPSEPKKVRPLKDISDDEISQWLTSKAPGKPDQSKQTQSGPDPKVREASYPGNIGAIEVYKFLKLATPEQVKIFKKLIDDKQFKTAWALIQGVTGINLQGDEFNENNDQDVEDKHSLIDAFRDFLPFILKELKLKNLPKIKLRKHIPDEDQPTFGRFENDSRTINLGIKNRHPIDILRTLAHELVHYKQLLNNGLNTGSGETGSDDENQANVLAGIVMRKFNKKFPQYINSSAISFNENFADGRNPQDKGDSRRHGIPKGASIAQLKKIRSSKTASPRKKQLAHWQINMRQGRKK